MAVIFQRLYINTEIELLREFLKPDCGSCVFFLAHTLFFLFRCLQLTTSKALPSRTREPRPGPKLKQCDTWGFATVTLKK